MAHWGWYWKVKKKHLSKTSCSNLISIDSFKLYHGNKMTGFQVQPLDLYAQPTSQCLKISYSKRKAVSYTIDIERIPCNYGGYRAFFKCPLCKKRMRFLYFAQKSIFLCRECLNLSYKSQNLRPSERYAHMRDKVKTIVEQKGGSVDRYQKPPRMHTKTFKNLRLKKLYYEDKSHQALNHEIRLWHGEKAELYLDTFFDYVDESKEWRKKKVIASL